MTIKVKGTKKKTRKAQEDALSSSSANGSGKSTVASINNEAIQQAMDLSGFRENCCHHCGVSNEDIGGFLLQCAACKKAYYCGMACFNAAIDVHMQFCMTSKLDKEPEGRKEAVAVPQKKEAPKTAKKASAASLDETKRKPKSKSSAKAAPKKRTSKAAEVKKVFIDSSCSDSEDYETESESESEQTNPRRGGRRPGQSSNAPTVSLPHVYQTDVAAAMTEVAKTIAEQSQSPTTLVNNASDDTVVESKASVQGEKSNHPKKGIVDLTIELGARTDDASAPETDRKDADADVTSCIEAIEPSVRDAEPDLLASDASDLPLEGDAQMSNKTADEETEDKETCRTKRGGGLVGDSGRAVKTLVDKATKNGNDEDDDLETSRHRRGGGHVNSGSADESNPRPARKALGRAPSSKSNVEWSKPDWTDAQLKAWRSVATEIQQDELADNVEAATEESAVDQDAALSSTLPTNSTLNDSDEDAEETRRRRGGGLVALSNERAASKDATVKRSSSLALRSSSHGKNQGDNREWTDNELLAWKMAAAEAKKEAQDAAAIVDDAGRTLGGNSDEPMSQSNELDASDSEGDDEDVEETRRRRGGGVVAEPRRLADPNMKRSSSLTLRSATEKKTDQPEVPDWTLSQLQAWRSAASEINREFQSGNDTIESDDDEFEETRQRRGGGAVHGRSVVLGDLKRSSSLVLRNTTISKQAIETDKPEWTESHLRATEHGEAIKSKGSIVPAASSLRSSATPEWISKRNLLKSASNRDLLRQESERSIGIPNKDNIKDDSPHASWATNSTTPTWVSQRSLRSTSNRDLSRQESERSLGAASKCECKHDAPEATDGIVTPSMRRSMLKKCQSCRLHCEPTVLPDIVRRAQLLRKEKSATNVAIAE